MREREIERGGDDRMSAQRGLKCVPGHTNDECMWGCIFQNCFLFVQIEDGADEENMSNMPNEMCADSAGVGVEDVPSSMVEEVGLVVVAVKGKARFRQPYSRPRASHFLTSLTLYCKRIYVRQTQSRDRG